MSEPVIHMLDEATANQIAAGEVVERPASVIKELVENAIDAGSNRIEVEIAEGGTTYIRVTDNGSGMAAADAKLAVLRHATSKIKTVHDLTRIETLGFRGEALPSIASVSQFTLTTRRSSEEMATYLELHGGLLIDSREAGAAPGTTVIVRELFYNTPARRKFLKTVATESNYIHNILGKLALSKPDIAFTLINNGRLVLSTGGSGRLLDAIAALYGHKLHEEVLPVDYQDNGFAVSGYVAKPAFSKSSRQWQTLFVNSRIVNSRMISKALDSAYHSLLPKNGYPLAVLALAIPPQTVDVNVHPQKSEVKFSDEQLIYRLVYKAVTGAVNSPLSLSQAAAALAPEPAAAAFKPSYTAAVAATPAPPAAAPHWRENSLPLSFAETRKRLEQNQTPIIPAALQPPLDAESGPAAGEAEFVLQPLGQVQDCYIIARGEDGVYIIDQHAAHERILYDRLAGAADRIPVQPLLVPLYWDFDLQEINLLEEHQTLFAQLGLTFDLVGPHTIRLAELPADMTLSEAEPLIREVLRLIQETQNPSSQTIRHQFLQMAACRSAIKAGDCLNMRQMQALLEELCATRLPYTCPHGRPTIIKFTGSDLEKMFKRT